MVHSFACVLGSFIDDDWNIIERVVNFKVLEDKEHEGLHGGKAFADSACGIGCFNKISPFSLSARFQIVLTHFHASTVTTDNASVNDTLVAVAARVLLAKYGIPASPQNMHVRCMCHVVNLVVQAILHALSEAEDPDLTDYFDVDAKESPVHSDPTRDDDQREMDDEEFDDETEKQAGNVEKIEIEDEEKVQACKGPVSKVCTVPIPLSLDFIGF